MEGAENITEKYAVYIDKNGADALHVVVDTEAQAKAELEKLKSTTSYGHISKAKVSNFGKPDEKTIESNIIEQWDSKQNATGKLSDAQQQPQVQSVQNNVPPPVVEPVMPIPVVDEKKLWEDYYMMNGSLIGIGYEFEGYKKIEITPAVVAPVLENGGEAKGKEALAKMTSDIKAKLSLIKLLEENKIQGFGVIQEGGKFFIEVSVEKKSEELEKELPKEIDGMEVKVVERPKIVAQKEPIKEVVK